jgi:hypothetical protein
VCAGSAILLPGDEEPADQIQEACSKKEIPDLDA